VTCHVVLMFVTVVEQYTMGILFPSPSGNKCYRLLLLLFKRRWEEKRHIVILTIFQLAVRSGGAHVDKTRVGETTLELTDRNLALTLSLNVTGVVNGRSRSL